MTAQILLMWAAVTLYAVGAVLFIVGIVFRKDAVTRVALWGSVAGIAWHVVAIGVRWTQVGHGPYLGYYEVASAFALTAIVTFVITAFVRPQLRIAGTFVMPVALLLLAGSMLSSKSGLQVTPELAGWWLVIHIAFAYCAFGCLVAAFGIAGVYLLRARLPQWEPPKALAGLPDQDVLDDLSYRFVGAGFVFLAIMIAAGSIWANEAWGRYWAWDPIETWSLITLLVYATYLHLRLIMGWRGERAAWVVVAALPVALFTLVGVPVAYTSIHSFYITG